MKVEMKYSSPELYCLLYNDQFMSTLAYISVIILRLCLSSSSIDCTADLVFLLDLFTYCWYLSAFAKMYFIIVHVRDQFCCIYICLSCICFCLCSFDAFLS